MTLELCQVNIRNEMLKIATLRVLVGELGLGSFGLILVRFLFFKFKSLKCTVSLRSLYNWIALVASLCAVA